MFMCVCLKSSSTSGLLQRRDYSLRKKATGNV